MNPLNFISKHFTSDKTEGRKSSAEAKKDSSKSLESTSSGEVKKPHKSRKPSLESVKTRLGISGGSKVQKQVENSTTPNKIESTFNEESSAVADPKLQRASIATHVGAPLAAKKPVFTMPPLPLNPKEKVAKAEADLEKSKDQLKIIDQRILTINKNLSEGKDLPAIANAQLSDLEKSKKALTELIKANEEFIGLHHTLSEIIKNPFNLVGQNKENPAIAKARINDRLLALENQRPKIEEKVAQVMPNDLLSSQSPARAKSHEKVAAVSETSKPVAQIDLSAQAKNVMGEMLYSEINHIEILEEGALPLAQIKTALENKVNVNIMKGINSDKLNEYISALNTIEKHIEDAQKLKDVINSTIQLKGVKLSETKEIDLGGKEIVKLGLSTLGNFGLENVNDLYLKNPAFQSYTISMIESAEVNPILNELIEKLPEMNLTYDGQKLNKVLEPYINNEGILLLQQYTILPVQRGPRYILQLRDLTKALNEDEKNPVTFKAAMEKMNEIASKTNKLIEVHEDLKFLSQVEKFMRDISTRQSTVSRAKHTAFATGNPKRDLRKKELNHILGEIILTHKNSDNLKLLESLKDNFLKNEPFKSLTEEDTKILSDKDLKIKYDSAMAILNDRINVLKGESL
jgi:hypothetical protein